MTKMKHIEFDFSLRIFCEMRMKRFISRCQIMLLYVQRKFSENSELLIIPEKHSDFKSLLYFIQKARQILCSLKIWGNYSRNENFYDYYQKKVFKWLEYHKTNYDKKRS